jgi:hypothetical protein
MGYQVDFEGGPWDRKREEWNRFEPPDLIEVPKAQGGPFLYRLVRAIGPAEVAGMTVRRYAPDHAMAFL